MSILRTSNTYSLPIASKSSVDDEQNKALELYYNRYKDKMFTLPKEKGWLSENLYLYQGFWHESKRGNSLVTVMAAQDLFKALPTDIYLATLPKSGTTWLKALTFTIVNRTTYKTNYHSSSHPLHIHNPHILVPSLEPEILKTSPTYVDGHSPRIFGTHIPYSSLPQSVLDSGCRLVYMCRNPKDVLVSAFHFANKLRHESLGPLTLEEAFKAFRKGVSPYGAYWDHVKGYYKAWLEHPTTILFLTYEDMTKDTINNLKRLAEFLGYPFMEEEEANGVFQDIIQLCNFENLKEANKNGTLRLDIPNNVFFREGKIGGWSNHLTKEMSRILDEITNEEFDGLNISI